MDARDRITRSRSTLLCRFRFFGQLAMYLKPVEDNVNVPTMATDGRHIFWNRKFVELLDDESLSTVIVHEVMHAAYGHMWRRGGRNPMVFNMAGDYVINLQLEHCGLRITADEFKWLIDKKYVGMCVEEVYDDLMKNAKEIPQDMIMDILESAGSGGEGDNDNDNAKGGGVKLGKESDDALEREWKKRIVAAVRSVSAKDRGTLPGDLVRMVDELVNPRVDWRQVLKRFFTINSRNDYIMIPPNRRFLHQDIYLPSLNTPSLGTVCVAVDTSGSIDEDTLRQFLSEVRAVIQAYDCELHLFYIDTRVCGHETYTKHTIGSLLDSKPKGGGGTAFEPFFDKIEELNLRPTVGLYLTDAYGSFPDDPPSFPVLWVLTEGHGEVPWGESAEL